MRNRSEYKFLETGWAEQRTFAFPLPAPQPQDPDQTFVHVILLLENIAEYGNKYYVLIHVAGRNGAHSLVGFGSNYTG